MNMIPVMVQSAQPTISVTYTRKEPAQPEETAPPPSSPQPDVSAVQEQVDAEKSEEVLLIYECVNMSSRNFILIDYPA
jgi:hypothetical protein